MKHTDPEYGKQIRPRSSSNDSRAGAKETVAVCKREGCDKAQADAPNQRNAGYCSTGCAKKAKKAKKEAEEAQDKSSSASPSGSPKGKGVLKKDERVQHTVAQFQPAEDDLLRIHAALNEEMGYAFQVQVTDIIHRRDHVLTIQATENIQEGEMQVVSVAPVATIEKLG